MGCRRNGGKAPRLSPPPFPAGDPGRDTAGARGGEELPEQEQSGRRESFGRRWARGGCGSKVFPAGGGVQRVPGQGAGGGTRERGGARSDTPRFRKPEILRALSTVPPFDKRKNIARA